VTESIPAVHGRLLTSSFVRTVLPSLPGAASPPESVVRALGTWLERVEALLGPASSLRAVTDVAVIPLLGILGFRVVGRTDHGGWCRLDAGGHVGQQLPVIVVPWAESLDRAWRDVVLEGIAFDVRWCFSSNGAALRIVDAQRTWSRQYLEFDFPLLANDEEARTVLWSIARADAFAERPLLDLAVEQSAQYGLVVCRALGSGMLDAVGLLLGTFSARRERGVSRERLFEESLTILYRVLFLLFAEARGLLPSWHPAYRDRYSLDAIVSALVSGHLRTAKHPR
jgi:hypothetical protein